MTARAFQRDINLFTIVVEAQYNEEKSIDVSQTEFKQIAEAYNIWWNEYSRAGIEKRKLEETVSSAYKNRSERKLILNRLSFLEAWKKRTISYTQRKEALIHKRLTDLELGKHDWDNALYTQLNDNVKSLEEYINSTPSRLTQNLKIMTTHKELADLKQYLMGELDTIIKMSEQTKDRVTELERLDGLHQMFSKQHCERIAAVEGMNDKVESIQHACKHMRDNTNALANEQYKLNLDTKHLNQRLRVVEEKLVSADIEKDKSRDNKGRFVRKTNGTE